MVRIKSIHNIGYKTAFYTSLYLLLSDSIQNILITFEPENTHHVSFEVRKQVQIHSTSCVCFAKFYFTWLKLTKQMHEKTWCQEILMYCVYLTRDSRVLAR